MKKVLLVLSGFLLITGCGKKEETKEVEEPKVPDAVVELENKEVEINEELMNTSGIVKTENCDVITTEEKVDTSVLGETAVTIKVKDLNGVEKEYTYKVNVKDSKAPTISYKEKLTVTEGTKIDLLKNVSAKDNSGEKIKVTVEGKYDFNKVGTYKLQYVAKDSSGNETKRDFSLVVKAKPVVVEKKDEPSSENKTTNDNKNSNISGSTAKAGKVTDSSLNGTKTSKGYTITVKNGVTYIDGVLIANKTYALPSSYNPGGLTSQTNSASQEMFNAAKGAGYNMWAQSKFRSYSTQNKLYNNYVKSRGKSAADTFSARPGHSEHQTGLAFDVCAKNKPCINSDFNNTAEAKWLAANAYKYGFILRYPKGKESITGYKYESWHFRYVGKDLAAKLYNGGNWITLEEHFGITSKYDY